MENYAQLGTLGIISVLAIKEFFAYLKAKKESTNGGDSSNAVLKELQLMNSNHLNSIQHAIEEGNAKIVSAFQAHSQNEHNDSNRLATLLGEIKGLLSK